jgi:hypothetical protein
LSEVIVAGCAEQKNFFVKAGATFNPIIRWGSKVLASAAITGITQGTPVRITAPAHGVPNGWPVALVGIGGMSSLNATRYPPVTADFHDATVVDADTISLNDISSALLPAYLSGGSVVWNTPQQLAGVQVKMTFWADANHAGAPLSVLTNGSGITVDSAALTIIPLLQTAGLAWNTTTAYYDLDVTDASGDVINLFTGTLTIQ